MLFVNSPRGPYILQQPEHIIKSLNGKKAPIVFGNQGFLVRSSNFPVIMKGLSTAML